MINKKNLKDNAKEVDTDAPELEEEQEEDDRTVKVSNTSEGRCGIKYVHKNTHNQLEIQSFADDPMQAAALFDHVLGRMKTDLKPMKTGNKKNVSTYMG